MIPEKQKVKGTYEHSNSTYATFYQCTYDTQEKNTKVQCNLHPPINREISSLFFDQPKKIGKYVSSINYNDVGKVSDFSFLSRQKSPIDKNMLSDEVNDVITIIRSFNAGGRSNFYPYYYFLFMGSKL